MTVLRTRRNPVVFWTVRALLHPVFTVLFGLRRDGRERLARDGPLLLAANHRSVLDPIVVALLLRRPVYYMAKRELFHPRWQGWFLRALGGFPVDRHGSDQVAFATALDVLRRGDCLVIFPEGRCMPPGPLGRPRRGVGRLAVATGAPVVPVAIVGTETAGVRRRIRVRLGAPVSGVGDDVIDATTATARIWAAVTAEWEGLTRRSTTESDATACRITLPRSE